MRGRDHFLSLQKKNKRGRGENQTAETKGGEKMVLFTIGEHRRPGGKKKREVFHHPILGKNWIPPGGGTKGGGVN